MMNPVKVERKYDKGSVLTKEEFDVALEQAFKDITNPMSLDLLDLIKFHSDKFSDEQVREACEKCWDKEFALMYLLHKPNRKVNKIPMEVVEKFMEVLSNEVAKNGHSSAPFSPIDIFTEEDLKLYRDKRDGTK